MEKCTIIVDARDRFSTTTKCLDTLLANTPEPHDLIVVMGGAVAFVVFSILMPIMDMNPT